MIIFHVTVCLNYTGHTEWESNKMENKNYGFKKYLNEAVVNPEVQVEGTDDGVVTIFTKSTSGQPISIIRDIAWHVGQGLKGYSKFMFDYDDPDEDKDPLNTKKIFQELDFGKTATGKDLTKIRPDTFKSGKIIIGFKKHDKKWVEDAAKTLIDAVKKYDEETKKEKQKQKDIENSPEWKESEKQAKRAKAAERKAELAKLAPPEITKRVSARKYQGDDYASWAVFIDGRPFVTGLTQTEVPYYKKQAYKKLQGK